VNASPTELSVAFAAGLAGVASPCMLPLVPGYLSFVSGVSATDLADRRRQVATSAGAFVLGFGAVFTAAGAGAGLLGAQFVSHRRGLELVGGVLVVLFGLILLLPAGGRLQWIRQPVGRRPRSHLGALLTGSAFAVGWSPCLTPTLGSILTIAGAAGHAAQGALLLAAYSLGMGIPIVLAGLFFTEFLTASRPIRRHLDVITQIAGVVLVFTGILLATGRLEEITARLAQ
jgi:cytochrome c-type biogenesis protein